MNINISASLRKIDLSNHSHNLSQTSITERSNPSFVKDLTQINSQDHEYSWSRLHQAIIYENQNELKFLLQNGADPNIKCKISESPLHYAVEKEKLEFVKILLEFNANPNITKTDGDSPLHLACKKQSFEIIEILLKYNANPNLQNHILRTPVHYAFMYCNDPTIIYLLVQFKGSIFILDQQENRPLDYVQNDEMRKVVDILRKSVVIENEEVNESISEKEDNITPEYNRNLEYLVVRNDHIKEFDQENDYSQNFYLSDLVNKTKNKKKEEVDEAYLQTVSNNNENSMNETHRDYFDKNFKTIKETENEDSPPKENQNTNQKNSNEQDILNTFSKITVKNFSEKEISEQNIEEYPNEASCKQKINFQEDNNKIETKEAFSITMSKQDSLPESNSEYNEYLMNNLTIKSISNKQTNNTTIETPKKINFPFRKQETYKREYEMNQSSSKNQNYINSRRKSNQTSNYVNNSLYRKPIPTMKKVSSYEISKENISPNSSQHQEILLRKLNFSTLENVTNDDEKMNIVNSSKTNKYLSKYHSGKKSNLTVAVNESERKLPSTKYHSDFSKQNQDFLKVSTNSFESSMSINDAKKLNEWLNSMGLAVYFDLFVENKIFKIDSIIELAGKSNRLNYNDFLSIGITKPGHIYRLLTRIDCDAKLINDNLINLILNRPNNLKNNNSLYFSKENQACCLPSNKVNSNHSISKFLNLDLHEFLKNSRILYLKPNFVNNGFDNFSYFLIQNYSEYIIDHSFLEDFLHIYDKKDRLKVLDAIENMMKILKKYSIQGEVEFEGTTSEECQICLFI